MDKGDICSLKDSEKMDANTIWQWRIMYVKKYSRHPEPFHYSDKMGLVFNVGSLRQKKKDLHLLTNGVILEVCDFAKTVQESKRHFITNILENNFDLGLKNEKQRTEFTSQILHKVRDLIRKPPEEKHEGFSLFDTSSEPECDSNSKNGLNMASTEHETDSFLKDMDDTDGSELDDFKCSQAASKENIKAEEMDGPHANNSDTEDELECSGPQSTEELREDVLPPSFPCCEEIDLNFDVWSKQSLDPGLLTKGVMLELVHFTRVLTASCRSIVLSVLDHNFELDLKSQQRKNQVWFKISQLLKRRERLITTGTKSSPEFKSEPFSFKPFKKGSYSVEASLYQLEENEDLLQNPTSSDIHSESQSRFLIIHGPFLTTTDGSPSLPILNSNVNPPFASQCGDEETIQIPTNVPNKCVMKQEEMETESNMWKLRANRGKQILSLLDKEYCAFNRSKKIGLEFDVGFGPKKNLSIDSLINSVLLEVAKFALAMNSSQQDFIMEILEYNFDFGLWSEKYKKTFACEVMKRVRQLKNSEDAVKFSKEVFELPVPVSSVNGENQSVGSVSPELSSISKKMEHDDVPVCVSDSQAETKDHCVDVYPFCEEIGLKLNVISSQPNKKLEINRLTNGAMTEVTNFAEKLCGTFEQICLDVLRHNFDLDWQSGDSDLARNILDRIPVILEQRNLSTCMTSTKRMKNATKDFSTVVELDCQNNTNLDTCSVGSFQAPTIDQNIGTFTDTEQEKRLHLVMWKLRSNQVQQILSVPHGEHCPLYSYSRCKKLGIDFNVGSGVKQNLDPKLLTNGIMVEVTTFGTALQSAQKDFITEILEYNFHLNLNNEFCRNVFATQVIGKFRSWNLKYTKPRNLKKAFQLPDSRYIEESSFLKTKYCPKCYQDRQYNLYQEKSDSGHVFYPRPHAITEKVTAETNCTVQKTADDLSSVLRASEETIMDNYPHCKKIGLSLFVEKDQRKDKLGTCVLTRAVMKEVASFARRLCGPKHILINDVLEHNFNFSIYSRDINPAARFQKIVALNNKGPTWFSEAFVLQPYSHRESRDVTEVKEVFAMQKNDRKETIKKRKLALQTKKEEATLRRHNMGVLKMKQIKPSSGDCLRNSASSDIGNESESSCPDGPFLTTTDGSSSLSTVNTNLSLPFASRGLCGDEKMTEIPRNEPNTCDMKQEEMETESNIWKLRANRGKQILSLLDKEYCTFIRSKTFGLEFDVGFGPKQNFNVDSLTNSVLLEVAKFALAMNSSQQDFIMEILEYNFDFGLWSEKYKKTFACEVMKRVRQLKNSEDAVKFSKEVFALPVPASSVNGENQSVGSVSPELSSISKKMEHDDVPVCVSDSQAETKDHCVDVYPFCEEIGLKLNVISSQPNKKLEINRLTNGAMTEVTNFAEKLCGTFEQICLDVLRHNFDLDWQSGDSDLARNILDRIPVILEQRNLSTCMTSTKRMKNATKDFSTVVELDCQNNTNLDTCSVGSFQAPTIDQNIGTFTDTEQEKRLHLVMWKLRSNQVQQILSVPHGEHCPLYSYSRCKKLGIDFNVGSGVKQNLDPKLLTNGIMVEVTTFGTALQSAQKDFITEILEYNFHLNLNNEFCRNVFATQVIGKFRSWNLKYTKPRNLKKAFQLPDSRYIEESSFLKTKYCPKCYQDRQYNLYQEKSDSGHVFYPRPHAITEKVTAETNCTVQKTADDLSSVLRASEETIMDNYPHCKKIGLSLFVEKDQRKDKLGTCVLTRAVMKEVASFARRLCGPKHILINDVLEHNFNFSIYSRDINPAARFQKIVALNNKGPTWFSEAFVLQPYSHRESRDVTEVKEVFAMQKNDRKETIKKRKLALQTKKEEATLRRHNMGVLKMKQIKPSSGDCLRNSASSDIGNESESSCPDGPFLTTTDGSSSLSTVNTNLSLPFASRGLCGDEKMTEIPRNEPNTCDMKQEEMETESNIWKLRANRGKQILSLLDKEYCTFIRSKTFGLEFDVGFGPKQNFNVDSLTNSVLLEVAKFALAMNSSQQDFIMEILEYNFDFGLWSEKYKKTFACEVMKRVRQLKNSEDAVKFSKEVFALPVPASSVNGENQCVGSVSPELSSISRTKERDDVPMGPSDSQAETKDHCVDVYPFCEEIGLKLNVISSQPNKKLEINSLTNGAMTEVTNFAEKLCGTFEQICLDVVRHNFDLDWQNGDFDLARNILDRIPVILEQRNLLNCITSTRRMKNAIIDFSTMMELDCQNTNLDTCSAGSFQAPTIDQNIGTSTDTEQEKKLSLGLWKLRTDQVQQILSVPHGEHCPLYSYSRCKKLGIDFNVGSGVKQNLDPKLLTNGIMVEVTAFVAALQSAQKDFITEILEYNFHLNLNNELCRQVFAQQVLEKFRVLSSRSTKSSMSKMVFELPDSRCIEESSYPKTKYCPKCYQDRQYNLCQDESDTVTAEANCTAQKPSDDLSSVLRATEETIMDSYPHCKKIGLSLIVDKDQPTDKLDTCVLTRGVMREVTSFAKRLCGSKNKLINDILEHNFNFGIQGRHLNPAAMFQKTVPLYNKGPTWFSDVFVLQPCFYRDPGDVIKVKEVSAMEKSERKEKAKKRQLVLQTKEEEATLQSDNIDVTKAKKNKPSCVDSAPICTEIGLDLDLTSKSGDKEKLDLKLLTRAVVMEIYRFAVEQVGRRFPDVVYEILDYNFDISSQHYRRLEFSIAAASKVKNIVKQYWKSFNKAEEVFKLPFVLQREASKRLLSKRQNKKRAVSSMENADKTPEEECRFVRKIRYRSDVNCIYFLGNVKTNEELWFDNEDTESLTDHGTIMQMSGSPVSGGCDSHLQGNLQIKEEECDPHYGDMTPELDAEEKYQDVKYLVQGEPASSLEYASLTICLNAESNIKRESEMEGVQYYQDELQVSKGYSLLVVCPDTENSVKTESETKNVMFVVPEKAAGSQGYSMINICQDTEKTSIKEEQENVPVESDHGGLVLKTDSEVDIKQEQDPVMI